MALWGFGCKPITRCMVQRLGVNTQHCSDRCSIWWMIVRMVVGVFLFLLSSCLNHAPFPVELRCEILEIIAVVVAFYNDDHNYSTLLDTLSYCRCYTLKILTYVVERENVLESWSLLYTLIGPLSQFSAAILMVNDHIVHTFALCTHGHGFVVVVKHSKNFNISFVITRKLSVTYARCRCK